MAIVDHLLPGDCLLYSSSGVFAWAIRIKTWSHISHCEVYVGHKQSVASRDGQGVSQYAVRTDGLYAVLRPTEPVDLGEALAWYVKHAMGQRYDWVGLFRFFTIGTQSMDKQFCSEFVTRFYRAGKFQPFASDYDADLVSPGMFLCSPHFTRVLL